MKFNEAPKISTENATQLSTVTDSIGKMEFDEDLFNIDVKKFNKKMIGQYPGLEAGDILGINKNIHQEFEEINLDDPVSTIDHLFNIDSYVRWICGALRAEREKTEKGRAKNEELKEYLQKSIQNLINCYGSILDTGKIGYLVELVIQDSFSNLRFVSLYSHLNISTGKVTTKHKDLSMPFGMTLPNMPNSEHRDSLDGGWFNHKDGFFKIKGSHLYKENNEGSWTAIDEMKEYTNINSDLINSKNIINLMAFDSFLSENFDLPIVSISFVEKIYLYKYMLTNSHSKIQWKFKPVFEKQKNKLNFIRTFLSIEQGGKEMGDKILNLGEKLPKEIAEKIFIKYGEYIDAVNDVEGVIKKEYKLPPSQELINKTKESLLIRGRDLLLAQNKKVSDGIFSEKKFSESIDNTKVGVDLFKNIFRIAKENDPETSFEDFAGLVPEHITSRDQIKDDEVSKIDEIIDKNYQSEDLRKAVKESFHKALESNKTTLNLLRRDEEIIALDRIDQREDGTLYFGSFNVDPDYCSSKIGAAFFEATVLPLMKKEIVMADCSALQPIASYYIESGFVSNKLYDYKGEPSFSLESIPDKKFISKDLTKLQIVEAGLKNEMIEGLIIKSASSQKEIMENNIPEDYILARYFFDKDTKKWFSVLEKTN